MLPTWAYLVCAFGIAALAFGIGQFAPGLGMAFVVAASTLWTAYSLSRARRQGN